MPLPLMVLYGRDVFPPYRLHMSSQGNAPEGQRASTRDDYDVVERLTKQYVVTPHSSRRSIRRPSAAPHHCAVTRRRAPSDEADGGSCTLALQSGHEGSALGATRRSHGSMHPT